jgi:hypothetical protein
MHCCIIINETEDKKGTRLVFEKEDIYKHVAYRNDSLQLG